MSEEEREILARIVLAITLRVALLCVIPLLIAIGLAVHESRARSDANRELIAANAEIRLRLVRGFKRSDVLNCRAAEKLKEQNRAEAKRDYRRLDETLGLLGIPHTPAIEARALEELQTKLRRNKKRVGPGRYGCGDLPPRFGEGG